MKKLAALGCTMIVLAGCAPAPAPAPAPEAVVPASSSSSQKALPVALSSKAAAVKPGCYPGSCGTPPLTDEQERKILSADAYKVMREAGTEAPFTSPLLNEHRAGTFVAADTGEPLFRSETKFDSGTGWPSFYAPISPTAVIENTDTTLGISRTEVVTYNGSHLGHVFPDGPKPTGLRYCMNGLALRFIPDATQPVSSAARTN